MSAGHVGKWTVSEKTGSPFSAGELQAIEKQGYVIVTITSWQGNTGTPPNHVCYARYRGGQRNAASG